ncbi:Fic family protein [Clostridium sp. Cult2]|uniref:Fic family protein n=1 Tax=Clostridium sp. Cult2 TaxID=2079003 RepID=UPI003FA4ABFD
MTGSNYPVTKVENIQGEIEDLCKWIKTERKIYHPVEFAALFHKKIVFIHPFKDGNQIGQTLDIQKVKHFEYLNGKANQWLLQYVEIFGGNSI